MDSVEAQEADPMNSVEAALFGAEPTPQPVSQAVHNYVAPSTDRRPGRLPVWVVLIICLVQGVLLYAFIVWRNIRHRIQVKQHMRDTKSDTLKD
mmetsp:Transcript_74076/g.128517  ORF Transcript_74076/g.128517 Transcript_74076/m.128517 type:complete len:94 (-) Transcript_74076:82-363(-)